VQWKWNDAFSVVELQVTAKYIKILSVKNNIFMAIFGRRKQ
jgi:hypothetical protein